MVSRTGTSTRNCCESLAERAASPGIITTRSRNKTAMRWRSVIKNGCPTREGSVGNADCSEVTGWSPQSSPTPNLSSHFRESSLK